VEIFSFGPVSDGWSNDTGVACRQDGEMISPQKLSEYRKGTAFEDEDSRRVIVAGESWPVLFLQAAGRESWGY
jgi:hypothetical protein